MSTMRRRPEIPEGIIGNRIIVRNLPADCRQEDLKQMFGGFGPIENVHLPTNLNTGAPLHFAYIRFLNPADAAVAKHSRDGTSFQNRLLSVTFAEDPSAGEHSARERFSLYGPQRARNQRARNHGGPAPFGSRQDSRHQYEANYNHREQGNYFPQTYQRGGAPPEQRGFRGVQHYASPQGGSYGQQAFEGRGPAPFGSSPGNYFPRRYQRGVQHYASPQGGSYGQQAFGGQRSDPTFGQNNPRPGGDQNFPQMEQRGNMLGGEQRTYAASGTMGTDQDNADDRI